MRDEVFPGFLQQATLLFAHENVAAGRWSEVGSIERAFADNSKLLHAGLATPGQSIFEINDVESASPVGYLWLAEMPRDLKMFSYVCQVYVEPTHRRRGYARAALQLAERFAVDHSHLGVGLHVFSHNLGAHALYQALGYQVTSMNMFKPLSENDGKRASHKAAVERKTE